ncbi:MAG: FMN-binding protein [Planctomycetes bacterium]|nr:FMN-binding protein [Planctomycetota bacterium]
MIRTALKFVVILALVCTLMGSGVAVLYGLWEGKIAAREAAARQAAIRAAVPEGAAVDADHPVAGQAGTESAVYAATNAEDKVVAYVAAGAAQGYASTVRVMVGAKPTPEGLVIHTVVVTSQAETPGLGAQVAEHRSTYTLWQKLFGADEPERTFNPFLDRFPGKRHEALADIQAITAATITSNAVKAAVDEALGRIREAIDTKP